jgi:hypothetical protein
MQSGRNALGAGRNVSRPHRGASATRRTVPTAQSGRDFSRSNAFGPASGEFWRSRTDASGGSNVAAGGPTEQLSRSDASSAAGGIVSHFSSNPAHESGRLSSCRPLRAPGGDAPRRGPNVIRARSPAPSSPTDAMNRTRDGREAIRIGLERSPAVGSARIRVEEFSPALL